MANDLPRDRRLHGKVPLVVDKYTDEEKTDDEWCQDLRRIPREADAAPSQRNEGKRCSSNDNEIASALDVKAVPTTRVLSLHPVDATQFLHHRAFRRPYAKENCDENKGYSRQGKVQICGRVSLEMH